MAAEFGNAIDKGAAPIVEILVQFEPEQLLDESVCRSGRNPAAADGLGDLGVAGDQTRADLVHDVIDKSDDRSGQCCNLGQDRLLLWRTHRAQEASWIAECILQLLLDVDEVIHVAARHVDAPESLIECARVVSKCGCVANGCIVHCVCDMGDRQDRMMGDLAEHDPHLQFLSVEAPLVAEGSHVRRNDQQFVSAWAGEWQIVGAERLHGDVADHRTRRGGDHHWAHRREHLLKQCS